MRLALSESLKRERGLVHISKNMLSVSFQQTFLGNAVNLSRTLDSFYLIWVFQTFCLRKKMVSYYGTLIYTMVLNSYYLNKVGTAKFLENTDNRHKQFG